MDKVNPRVVPLYDALCVAYSTDVFCAMKESNETP